MVQETPMSNEDLLNDTNNKMYVMIFLFFLLTTVLYFARANPLAYCISKYRLYSMISYFYGVLSRP